MEHDVARELNLHNIKEYVQLSEGKTKQLMETCIWCLVHCKHSSGVKLRVEDENNTDYYSLIWSNDKIDHEAIFRSYNKDDATECGAEAIALMLSIQRTEYTAVERAITTTGIDYWLGFKNRNPNYPFHRASRLEISGIMTESITNTISSRVKRKIKQTKPTDYTSFPIYVIIVEFSKPYAIMVLKNVNS